MHIFLPGSRIRKNLIQTTLLVLVLVLGASALHLFSIQNAFLNAAHHLLTFLIYIGLIAAWTLSFRRRIIHGVLRRYLTVTAGLMTYLLVARTVKFVVFRGMPLLKRQIWYSYYVPILLIPLLAFWAASYLGSSEEEPLTRSADRWMLLPTLLLLVAIMTNELHQLAFGPSGSLAFSEDQYSHGVFFYLAALWALALVLAMLFRLVRKSHVPGTRKIIWLPLGLVGLEVLYSILYAIDSSRARFGFIDMPVMTCLMSAALWESCIQTGLITANTQYGPFFEASAFSAQIIDAGYTVRYRSSRAPALARPLRQAVVDQGPLWLDHHTRLHAAPVQGGHVLWLEDSAAVQRLIDQLSDVGEKLRKDARMLQSAYDLQAREIRLRERIRLYELLQHETRRQAALINTHLDGFQQADPQTKKRLLFEINLLGAYIKRRCNLTLLAEHQQTLSSDELRYSINESLETLKLGGVQCALSLPQATPLDAAAVLLAYDFFQQALEETFGRLTSLFVLVTTQTDQLTVTIQLETPAALCQTAWLADQAGQASVCCERLEEGLVRLVLDWRGGTRP